MKPRMSHFQELFWHKRLRILQKACTQHPLLCTMKRRSVCQKTKRVKQLAYDHGGPKDEAGTRVL